MKTPRRPPSSRPLDHPGGHPPDRAGNGLGRVHRRRTRDEYLGQVSIQQLRRMILSGADAAARIAPDARPQSAPDRQGPDLDDRKPPGRHRPRHGDEGTSTSAPSSNKIGKVVGALGLEEIRKKISPSPPSRRRPRAAEPRRRTSWSSAAPATWAASSSASSSRPGRRVRVLDSFIYGRRSLAAARRPQGTSRSSRAISGTSRPSSIRSGTSTPSSSWRRSSAIRPPSTGPSRRSRPTSWPPRRWPSPASSTASAGSSSPRPAASTAGPNDVLDENAPAQPRLALRPVEDLLREEPPRPGRRQLLADHPPHGHALRLLAPDALRPRRQHDEHEGPRGEADPGLRRQPVAAPAPRRGRGRRLQGLPRRAAGPDREPDLQRRVERPELPDPRDRGPDRADAQEGRDRGRGRPARRPRLPGLVRQDPARRWDSRPGQTIPRAAKRIDRELGLGRLRNPYAKVYYNHYFDATEES